MMNIQCTDCGAVNAGAAASCYHCRRLFTATEPRTTMTLAEGPPGTPLGPPVCANCGRKLDRDVLNCPKCGAPAATSVSAATRASANVTRPPVGWASTTTAIEALRTAQNAVWILTVFGMAGAIIGGILGMRVPGEYTYSSPSYALTADALFMFAGALGLLVWALAFNGIAVGLGAIVQTVSRIAEESRPRAGGAP